LCVLLLSSKKIENTFLWNTEDNKLI
jgi:hypothetical protein